MLLIKHSRKFVLGLAVAALLLLYGCVELTGQRFTWFHDALKDTFYVFIQYDGIHEGSREDKGEDQIPDFIQNQDIMILLIRLTDYNATLTVGDYLRLLSSF